MPNAIMFKVRDLANDWWRICHLKILYIMKSFAHRIPLVAPPLGGSILKRHSLMPTASTGIS
jgi:hypothetical protein